MMIGDMPFWRPPVGRVHRSRIGLAKSHFLLLLAGLSFGSLARSETIVFPEFTVPTAQTYLVAQSAAFESRAGAGADTYFLLARLQNHLGHQDAAERLARQALGFDSRRADIHSFLGRIFLGDGRLEEAADCFRKSLALDPKAAGDHRRLGMVLDQLGDHEGARKALSAAIDLTPTDATAQLMLGRLLLDQGKAVEAISHLEQACKLDGTLINAFYVLSQAQGQVGDKGAAAESLKSFQRLRVGEKENLVTQDARYDDDKEMRRLAARFHTDVADYFFERGREDLAEAHLKQAVHVAPDDAQAYILLARIYLNARRELPHALELCRRCVTLQPSPANFDLLAQVCFLNGRSDEARDASAQAVRLDPRNPVYADHARRFSQKP
jgi:tetratricopeptide (TPR) repeat protein